MNRKDKIKQHIADHKAVYITVAVSVVAVAGGYVGYRLGSARNVEQLVKPRINQILSYKPEATLEVYIEALGDPGDIIQDMTTGTIYASQGQAARELGIQQSSISKQLRGLTEHVNGHRFEFLAKAVASDPRANA